MATSPMGELLQQLCRTVLLRDGARLTDGQLLEDYLSRRDEAALAALVQRHGPMVWGVCCRVLGNYHDAEDAFQATFLVLVRKATSVVPREMVANWLYGVAHQTALKARATVSTRKGRERQVVEMPEPAVVEPAQWDVLQPVLDEELNRLPEKYRAVVVLCDLEGRTRKEAARQLGVPEGTVGGWIARARVILAKRLVQRGITLSGGALATILSQNVAAAGVPSLVVSKTIEAASLFAAGQAAAHGLISVKAAALTEGVLKAMFLTKLKVVGVLCVVAGLTGAAGLIYQTLAAEPTKQPQADEKPKVTKTEEPEKQPKEDLDKLQGTWQLVTSETDGLRIGEGRPEIKDSRLVFEKSAVTLYSKSFHSRDVPLPPEDLKMKGALTLDPRKQPKEITFTWENKDFNFGRGIYELNGDSLKICLSLDKDAKTFPKEFSAGFDSKRWLLNFKRGPAVEVKGEKKP